MGDAEAWEFAAEITEKTAAGLYLAHVNSQPPHCQVVKVASAAGFHVLVDAASRLPPVENLRCCIDEGAGLVIFSGGKSIGVLKVPEYCVAVAIWLPRRSRNVWTTTCCSNSETRRPR